MRTFRQRLLGAKLIASYFLVKTFAFTVALTIVHFSSGNRAALGLLEQLAPLLQLMSAKMALLVAPAFIILGLAIVFGVWFQHGWAWALLFVECGIPLLRLVEFLTIALTLNWRWLSLIPSSPYFAIDVVSSMVIVVYLLQPNVMRAFGDTT